MDVSSERQSSLFFLNKIGVISLGFFLVTFLITKGSQFFIPVVLANILPREVYGSLEVAMSSALIILSVVSLGSTAFISRRLIQNESWISLSVIKFYLILVTIVLVGLSFLCEFLSVFPTLKLALIFCAVLLLQGTVSTELKSIRRRNASLIIDVLLWLALLVWAFLTYSIDLFHTSSYSFWFIALYFIALFIKVGSAIKPPIIPNWRTGVRYIKEGLNIVVMGFSGAVVASGGRLIVGFGIGDEAAGNFSALYRIAIFPIVFHQLIMLYFYKDSFKRDHERFKLLGASVFWIITIISVLFFFALHYSYSFFGEAFSSNFIDYPVAFLALMLTIPFWSATSINELAYYKEADSSFPNLVSATYILAVFLVTIYLISFDDLSFAASLVAIFVIGYFVINSLSLIRVGLPVAKSPIFAGMLVIVGLLVTL